MSDHCPGVSGSPPRLVEHPSDVLVARDEPATLRCEAATQPGHPPPTVTWMKDGAEVSSAMIFIYCSLHKENINTVSRSAWRRSTPPRTACCCPAAPSSS